jgi:hypothetical protein
MCPADVGCHDMVILIQYLIQTYSEPKLMPVIGKVRKLNINPLTLELNPSAQRCLTRFFTGDFAS